MGNSLPLFYFPGCLRRNSEFLVRCLDLSLPLPHVLFPWLLAFATGILKSFISPYTGVCFPGDSFSVFSVDGFPSWRDCF